MDTSTNKTRPEAVAIASGCEARVCERLAAIGLYGVISYTVARRGNELGIRMALGAQRSGVLWMVLRETLLLAVAGIALGVPVSLGATYALSSRLFGLTAADPLTLAAAIAVLLAVALVAGLIPGRGLALRVKSEIIA